ncbi:hypothetical protein A2572_00555 [Candidatus Collierbacteria bacterium RIFOXYD1_FULL_40_9]|uniref:SHS2 domain-containing protein n=1 Tax=Candidatus Collierbacteria bacterium RIFOXYD1_FULL_40_9 TaxID=1817731 RepID=A0A1F5FWP7_9BACT|nr:MAG: hypothetical protein A2572_00555 [Candidatus Collierbacteria bacterium RIFOXYD1_FULL_40_9]
MAKILSIDIGNSSIKALVVKDGVVKNVAFFPNRFGKLITVMSNSERIQLTDDIKSALRENGIGETAVVASLPESLVFAKTMIFPHMSTPELSTAIKWELDQSVPFPPNEIESSWSVFENNQFTGEDKIGTYVVAVPSKVSELYLQLFELLGLEPIRLENELLPLLRAFSTSLEDVSPSFVVDIGYSGIKIALANKAMIFGNYYFSVGGQAMTNVIADNFGLSMDQAEQYKRTYGMIESQLDGKIYRVLKPIVDNLILEIRKMSLTFRNEYGETRINKLLLTGGGSYLQGLAGYLGKSLEGVEVATGNVFEGQDLDPETLQLESLFSLAYGLST